MRWLRRRKRREEPPRDYGAEIDAFQRRIDISEDLRWAARLPFAARCGTCGGLGYRYFGGDTEAGPGQRVPCDDCHVSGRAAQ